MIRFRLSRSVAALALLWIAACGSDDDGGTTAIPTIPDYDFSAVDREIEDFVAERGLAGVGTILVHRDHGVIYQRSFGNFTDDRVYLIASASKMVSAGVLMRLADEGLLDIDRPIAEAVGWGEGNPSITPAQLVSNSSGLVGLLPNPAYTPYICQYLYVGGLEDCARQIFTTTRDDADVIPPDTQFRYGGAQWQVAGGLAEAVSGKSWEELIRETYSEPCGLEAFGYNNHFTQPGIASGAFFQYPVGFDGDPAVLLPTENPNVEGGAYATIGDYGKLLLMHLRGGLCGDNRVLSEESVRLMHSDRIAEAYGGSGGVDRGYGLGWWIHRDVEGLISDPGAYGAFPWIDSTREYAGFLALESSTGTGRLLFDRIYDLVNQAIEAAE